MHEWCKLEYEHMVSVIGPDHVYFTALTPKTLADMPETLAKAHCHTEDVLTMQDRIPHNKVCLLDPSSPYPLSPEDADTYDFFLFGGILGDDPPRGTNQGSVGKESSMAATDRSVYFNVIRPHWRVEKAGIRYSPFGRGSDDHRHCRECHSSCC